MGWIECVVGEVYYEVAFEILSDLQLLLYGDLFAW